MTSGIPKYIAVGWDTESFSSVKINLTMTEDLSRTSLGHSGWNQ